MKEGKSLEALVGTLVDEAEHKRDLLVPPPLMVHETAADGVSRLVVAAPAGPQQYDIGNVARSQLAEYLDIPLKYFNRMREEQPMLLDKNVNTWLQANPKDKRMLRTLRGHARAFLSSRYLRVENIDLIQVVIPLLNALPGCQIVSCNVTETKLFIKAVSSRITAEVDKGDLVQAGVVISNSEVGCGSVRVEPLVYRLVCKNGMIMPERVLRKAHIGADQGGGEGFCELYRADTQAAANKAFLLKVRDSVAAAISEANLRVYANRMRETSGIALSGDVNAAVEVLGNRFELNGEERSGVIRQLVLGGDLSGFGLLNAVTSYASLVDDYDRATDLESIGGQMLINLSDKQWHDIATAKGKGAAR